jgi:hypothetical protein
MLWDQTWKFEMNRLEDGRYEVKHVCTKFQGPFPVRLIIWLHQRYVIWACARFINTTDFGNEDADMDVLHPIMANIPLHVAKEFMETVTEEKGKKIEAMRNDPLADDQELEDEEKEYEILKQWKYDPISGGMKMIKKRVVVPGSVTGMGAAFKVKDKSSKDAMAVAMKEAKTNKKVKAAVQEMTENPTLEFVEDKPAAKAVAEPVEAEAPAAPAPEDGPVLEFTEAKPEEHTAELEVSDAAAKDKKDKEVGAKDAAPAEPKAEAAAEA